jgi:hypothetical protein
MKKMHNYDASQNPKGRPPYTPVAKPENDEILEPSTKKGKFQCDVSRTFVF